MSETILTNLQGKSGKVDVTIYRASSGGVRIPADMLAESIEVTGDEGTTSVQTFAGSRSQPSGTYDDPQVMFTVLLTPELLRAVYPELSDTSVDRPTIAGQTVFGGQECTVRENAKIVIHWTCDGNSDNDWYIPNVNLSQNFSATFTPNEVITLPITGYIQYSTEIGGLVQVGTGDLTEPTLFDASTGTYEAISS